MMLSLKTEQGRRAGQKWKGGEGIEEEREMNKNKRKSGDKTEEIGEEI